MDLKFSDKLKAGMRSCPVVFATEVNLPSWVMKPTDAQMKTYFPAAGYTLQTWGRTILANGKEKLLHDPHYIGIRGSTPLHSDPKYPRYCHHLKLRVDEGVICRGHNKEELKLVRGLFYILDAHSPHQVLSENPSAYNIGCDFDSTKPENPEMVINTILQYMKKNPPF